MSDEQFLHKVTQPYYITEVVRDGAIDGELQRVRETINILTKQHQALLIESRGTLAAASESTGVVIELWGSIEASLRALHTDLQCCEIIEPLDQSYLAQWSREREKLGVLTLIKKFIELSDSMPRIPEDQVNSFVQECPLSELLLISSNFAVKETLSNPAYSHILSKVNITRERVGEILRLAQAVKDRVLRDVRACLNVASQSQNLTHYLLIMENLSIIDPTQLRAWLTADCSNRIKECRALEDCVAVLMPFCETVLRASAVTRSAASLISTEIEALKSIRRDVWKDLAIQLSQAVKTVLEQQGAVNVQSFADFQIGLDRIAMAKDLESTVNMMAGPFVPFAQSGGGCKIMSEASTTTTNSGAASSGATNPRIKLKLRGTIAKLNSYITTRLTKQYRVFMPNVTNWNCGSLDQIEKSILARDNWEGLRNVVPKSDAVESIDILNKLLIMVETISHDLPDVSDTIVRWLAIAHLINTQCSTSDYNSNYLINNVIKMSKHPTEIANKLHLVDCV